MSRLSVAVRQDLRAQFRHGILGAVGFVSLVWVALLRLSPQDVRDALLPVALYVDVGVVGFLFVGGQILIERRQRTLGALGVSPLGANEYLAAKMVTLTGLAIGASLVVVLSSAPGTWAMAPVVVVAVVLLSLPALLLGFIVAARVEDVTRYLLLVQVVTAPVLLPLLSYAGIIPDAPAAVIPTFMPLQTLAGVTGFRETAIVWQVLGLAYGVGASLLLWRAAGREADRLLREVA